MKFQTQLMRCSFFLLLLLFISVTAFAQQISLNVTLDSNDWKYKTGEKATFTVSATKGDQPIPATEIKYEIGLEKMVPSKKGSLVLTNGTQTIDGGTLDKPGFLRCVVTATIEGKPYRGLATAAFSPEKIQPTTTVPKDFLSFWNKAKADAAKIPMDAQVTLLPEKSTATVNVYEVSIQNFKLGSRIYGIVSVPKKEGKYPAILKVPGAGVRPYGADVAQAEKGFIVMQIGIHGISVTMPLADYTKLANGELKGYPFFNHENKDDYYFKRVYMGCIRSIDYIFSLPQFDGKNLAVAGGSQGGALTIVTAALDPRVKHMVAYFPGLADLTGYQHGRVGGWPHMLKPADVSKAAIETSKYYDVVNFARLIKIPGFYSWGYNDETCPPTTAYAAYNVITAPKEVLIVKEAGHKYFPEQRTRMNSWIQEKLTAK
jgi:cephalosporin-C deacetylase